MGVAGAVPALVVRGDSEDGLLGQRQLLRHARAVDHVVDDALRDDVGRFGALSRLFGRQQGHRREDQALVAAGVLRHAGAGDDNADVVHEGAVDAGELLGGLHAHGAAQGDGDM